MTSFVVSILHKNGFWKIPSGAKIDEELLRQIVVLPFLGRSTKLNHVHVRFTN